MPRPVLPLQGMSYSRVAAPRALSWADLWLPLWDGGRKRNFKTDASGWYAIPDGVSQSRPMSRLFDNE